MKFNKHTIGLLLCGVALIATPIGSEMMDADMQANVLNAAMPAAMGIVALASGPLVAPILVGLVLIQIAGLVITGSQEEEKDPNALTNANFMNCHNEVMSQISKASGEIMKKTEYWISGAIHEIKSDKLMSEMCEALEYLRRTCSDSLEVVLDPSITGFQKNSTMRLMEDPHSTFRDMSRYFISKFIKANINLDAIGPSKKFFDYILEKDALLAVENKDSHTDSLHSKIFKAYLLFSKILTDANVLPIVAETIQYQGEVKEGRVSDAKSTKRDTLRLIEAFKQDIKTLIEQTQAALQKASREIRNSGSMILTKGVNYASLNFAVTIPRILNLGRNGCSENSSPFNKNNYEVSQECSSYKDFVDSGSEMTFYKNPNDNERPYQYVKYSTPDGVNGVLGHDVKSDDLVEESVSTDDRCPTVFCPAFKKDAVAICTQRVRADYGHVIVGVRFTVSLQGVLCIDIKQGKYDNILGVDPNTLSWKSAPAGGPVTKLNSKVRKIETGDFELEDEGSYLVGIQFKQGSARDGFIFVSVEGAKPGNWYSFPQGSMSRIDESNEISIDGDDPVAVGGNNLIKPFPEEGRSFIKLQPSNIKQDMGRTSCPLVDLREVVSYAPAPMTGLKIYIAAAEGSCGFLSLALITPRLDHLINFDQLEPFFKEATKNQITVG